MIIVLFFFRPSVVVVLLPTGYLLNPMDAEGISHTIQGGICRRRIRMQRFKDQNILMAVLQYEKCCLLLREVKLHRMVVEGSQR